MPSKDTPPKKRGAQPGNLNALKHGFYSKAFHSAELDAVHEIEKYDLAQEIDLLRLVVRRVVESADKAKDFESRVRFLSVLTYATAQLTRLLNVQETFERRKKYQQESSASNSLYQEYLDELRAMRAENRGLIKRSSQDPLPGGNPTSLTKDHQTRASHAPTAAPLDVDEGYEPPKYTQVGFLPDDGIEDRD